MSSKNVIRNFLLDNVQGWTILTTDRNENQLEIDNMPYHYVVRNMNNEIIGIRKWEHQVMSDNPDTFRAYTVDRNNPLVPQFAHDLVKAGVDFNFRVMDEGYQFVCPVHLQRTFLFIAAEIFGEDI